MKKVIHLDADCFYAAVEMRDNPYLRGQPIAVGGDPRGRGVVATCNYEARRFGVRSAMPSAQAKRLCPSLLFIRPRMDVYRSVAEQMRDIFADYSECIESVALDEAYLDVSATELCRGSATLIAREITQRVKKELGIPVSAGVSSIKFLAKVASDWRKPEGLFVIAPGDVAAFLKVLPVTRLPGVGKVTALKLERLGVYCCGDALELGRTALIKQFGSMGAHIYDMSAGYSDKQVRSERSRKSLSVERTFDQNYAAVSQCGVHLQWLMSRLNERLASLSPDVSLKNQFVKLKFDDFSQTTMTTALPKSLSQAQSVSQPQLSPSSQAALAMSYHRLLTAAWQRGKRPLRLIGIGLSISTKEVNGEQLSLALVDRSRGQAP